MVPRPTKTLEQTPQLLPKSLFGTRFLPFLLLLLAAAGVRLWAGKVPVLDGYDEQSYGFFVNTLGERGFDGLRQLIQAFPTDKQLQTAPLPFRLAFIVLGTVACKLAGAYDLTHLVTIALLAWLAGIMLGYALLRRWLDPAPAFLTAILLISSPLGPKQANVNCVFPMAGDGAARRAGSWFRPFLGSASSLRLVHYSSSPRIPGLVGRG